MKCKMCYKAKQFWKITPILTTGLIGGIIAGEQNASASTATSSSVNSDISSHSSVANSSSIHSSQVTLRSSQATSNSTNASNASVINSNDSSSTTTNNHPVNLAAVSSSTENSNIKKSSSASSASSYNYAPVNMHSNSIVQQMKQGIQSHQPVNSQTASQIGLNDNGQKIAQAAGLNINDLNKDEINALNHTTYSNQSYDGQMTYDQYHQYAQNVVDEKRQYAIPQFDPNKIENLPAATTADARTGKVEALDIWDSWPVVKADTGVPVNYHGYQLVVGMMGYHDDWNDGHLYLLYNKHCDENFNDWKVVGPIFGYNASDDYQQWSGSTIVNPDGSLQLYYTLDDHTDGNNNQELATATVDLNCGPDGISIKDVRNNKVLFKGDGYYYQTYDQWKNGSDPSADDYCLRDPHVIDVNGKRYLVFEANTGTYNYQSSDQVYNLNNYGEGSIGADVQDMFKIVNNPTVYKQSAVANACIGLMELGGNPESPTISKLYAPIVSTPLISDEIERPVIVPIDGKYYLFTDTRLNRGIMNEQNQEANKKIGDNVGMLGFVADSIDGNYIPLNGNGTILTASTSAKSRTSEYSWYAVPMPNKQGDNSRYILITAYMSNRDEAAGPGKNSTWGPSFVVKINPDGTTEVLDNSVTTQQGIWHEPCQLNQAFQASIAPNDAQQVHENGHWYLRENEKNLTGFQYIPGEHKTVYYNPQNDQMEYGLQKINGQWYYFDKSTGALLFGQHNVDGYKIYSNPVTGALLTKKDYQYVGKSKNENGLVDVTKIIKKAEKVNAKQGSKHSERNITNEVSNIEEISSIQKQSIVQYSSVSKRSLPQTGEADNTKKSGLISLGLAAILSIFSWGLKKKHN